MNALTWSNMALFGCILACSCRCVSPYDAVRRFERRDPEAAQKYESILPVTGELYNIIFRMKSSAIRGIGYSLKERYGGVEGIDQYAKRILDQEVVAQEEWNNAFAELRNAAANGGVVCEYRFRSNEEIEVGLLVIKAGRIVKRHPWFSDNVN